MWGVVAGQWDSCGRSRSADRRVTPDCYALGAGAKGKRARVLAASGGLWTTPASAQQIQELGALLKAGSLAAGYATEIWTLPRIGQLIHRHFQLQLSQSSVWRTLRHMGWSVQRPARQARERDERAVQAWKKKRWPQLKK